MKLKTKTKGNCDKCEAFNNYPVDQRAIDASKGHDQHFDDKELARDFNSKIKVEG